MWEQDNASNFPFMVFDVLVGHLSSNDHQRTAYKPGAHHQVIKRKCRLGSF